MASYPFCGQGYKIIHHATKKRNGFKWPKLTDHLKPFEHIVFPLLYFLP